MIACSPARQPRLNRDAARLRRHRNALASSSSVRRSLFLPALACLAAATAAVAEFNA
jgi:hypothetical protein